MTVCTSETGSFDCSVEHGWGQLPAAAHWGITHGVAVASDGRVFVAHTGSESLPDCVYAFDPRDGALLHSWGAKHVDGAHGFEIVHLGDEEVVLLTDLKRGLFCYTLQGELQWHCKKPSFYKHRPHLHWQPSNCTLDEQGRIHLADGYGSYFITLLDADGNELGMYGGPGLAESSLLAPHGLGLVPNQSTDSSIVITENRDPALVSYTSDGTFVRRITHEKLTAPRHVVQWGEYLLIPDLAGWLGVWDHSLNFHDRLGVSPYSFIEMFDHREDPAEQQPHGQFCAPHDVAVGNNNDLYVVEWLEEGRVSRISFL